MNDQITSQNASAAAKAKKKELQKLSKRGLRLKVVSRGLSDGSLVYSVQLVDCDEHSVLMLAELDCINEPKARRLREDIRNSLLHNSVVQLID